MLYAVALRLLDFTLRRSYCSSMTLNTLRAKRRTGDDGDSRDSASRSDAESTNEIGLLITDERLCSRYRKNIGGPCRRPCQRVGDSVHVPGHGVQVLVRRAEREYAKVRLVRNRRIERGAVPASVNDQLAIVMSSRYAIVSLKFPTAAMV